MPEDSLELSMDTAAGLHSLESFTMDQEPIRGQYPGHVTSISQSEDQETEAGAGETGVTEETVVYFTPGPEVRQIICTLLASGLPRE